MATVWFMSHEHLGLSVTEPSVKQSGRLCPMEGMHSKTSIKVSAG